MKAFAVIFILICAISHPVFPQWIAQNSGANQNLYEIEFLNERIGWAVGDAGVIIKTTNGGTNRYKKHSRKKFFWVVLIKFSKIRQSDKVSHEIMKHFFHSSQILVFAIAAMVTSNGELPLAIVNGFKNVIPASSNSITEERHLQQDTSELDNPPSPANELKDVSNMFNERGYYKSSGFSFEDQEIINDFNGNIIYTVPLYNFSVNARFNMRMKLNYNGSVSHGVMLGSTGTVGNGNRYRYNLNFPEWIIELNGIALQTFNFETNFFTNAENGQVAYGSSVNALVAGYHYSNEMKAPDETSPDRINILAGDGSVISLQNTFATSPANDPSNFRGDYEYKGKELYYKVLVSFIGDSSIPKIAKRKVILLKGDGLEYEFEEQVIDYFDFRSQDPVNYYLRPKVIYLKSISDRFSRKISVTYSGEHPYAGAGEQIMGRKLLSSVSFTGASSTLKRKTHS